MKTLIGMTVAAVSFASSLGFACSPKEAQFIGKVTVINKAVGANGELNCSIQVGNFRFYQESMLCPLDESVAVGLVLPAQSCNVQVGQEVSGILSVDQQGNVTW